jgi:hypothetical protein
MHRLFTLIFGHTIAGCLGLFHFMQRITKHMRPEHIDYGRALNRLKQCIYRYQEDDEARVLKALEEGTLNGRVYTQEDIQELCYGKKYSSLYGKYLRKVMQAPQQVRLSLSEWWNDFKVTSSSDGSPARGRLHNGKSLFTSEARDAVENAKISCAFLPDHHDMYRAIPASPNSTHGLTTWISERGESSLENFHGLVAHFGNNGMRASLCDALNLAGTARYNLKLILKMTPPEELPPDIGLEKIPSHFRDDPTFWNHSNLAVINLRARRCGHCDVHTCLRQLPEDNGE